MARASELRDLDDATLLEELRGARRELFGLRFQLAMSALENTASLRRAKRDVARVLTVARERGVEVVGERKART